MFARAMLARVKILIVEEAPSSVDLETEHLVQQVIGTVLFLSHNPFSVMHMDSNRCWGEHGTSCEV